jgi:hypothetical protein
MTRLRALLSAEAAFSQLGQNTSDHSNRRQIYHMSRICSKKRSQDDEERQRSTRNANQVQGNHELYTSFLPNHYLIIRPLERICQNFVLQVFAPNMWFCRHKAEICLARRHNLISLALKIAVQPYEALP